jgi:hypothetical protein
MESKPYKNSSFKITHSITNLLTSYQTRHSLKIKRLNLLWFHCQTIYSPIIRYSNFFSSLTITSYQKPSLKYQRINAICYWKTKAQKLLSLKETPISIIITKNQNIGNIFPQKTTFWNVNKIIWIDINKWNNYYQSPCTWVIKLKIT